MTKTRELLPRQGVTEAVRRENLHVPTPYKHSGDPDIDSRNGNGPPETRTYEIWSGARRGESMKRIRWDRVLILTGVVAGSPLIGAVRSAQRLETARLREQLASAQRFGIGAMEQAKREERRRRRSNEKGG